MEEETFTGIVYKISSPNTDKVYIGSTIRTIKQRLQEHKSTYKRYMDGKYRLVTSFMILENDDVVIEEVEKLENVTMKELHLREAYLIRNTENAINNHIPGRTQYQRYQDNIDRITELKKRIINCTCGKSFTISNMSRHNKSKKHLAYIASLAHTVINIQNLTINNK